jgi:hypothetical protein
MTTDTNSPITIRLMDTIDALREQVAGMAREWRVLAEDYSQFFASEAEANAVADWLVSNGNVGSAYVDSRTVGPWERAEVKQIEGEKK